MCSEGNILIMYVVQKRGYRHHCRAKEESTGRVRASAGLCGLARSVGCFSGNASPCFLGFQL